MNVKKHLTLTRAGIIESLQFRLSSLVIIAGNFIYLIIDVNKTNKTYF